MENNNNNIYAAGLFDGEGTVSLMKRRAKEKFKSPAISMTSTTIELVNFMKDNYGGNVRNHKVYKAHHKKAYVWSINYNLALSFISKVLPFIKEPTKRYRMQMLVSKYKLITNRNGKYNDVQRIAKEQFEYDFFHPSTPSVDAEQVPISL